MKNKSLITLFGFFGIVSTLFAGEIEVPLMTAELRTRDSKPVACGTFVRTLSIEVYDRYGERAKWAWQAQNLDTVQGETDSDGKTVFKSKKVANRYSKFKTRNPKTHLFFDHLKSYVNGECREGARLGLHVAKNLNQPWVRFGRGCVGEGVDSLVCEIVYTSSDLKNMEAIASEGLNYKWSEESLALYKELEKGNSKNSALITDLLNNLKTDVNARFNGEGSHVFETLSTWFFKRFDLNNLEEKAWFELFLQRGANIWARDYKLNSILHHLPSTSGALEKLKLLDSLVEDSRWLEQNIEGETPFARIAANGEDSDLIDFLLARSDRENTINKVDAYGLTPLGYFEFLHPDFEHRPRMKKHQLIYEKLIAAGAKLVP